MSRPQCRTIRSNFADQNPQPFIMPLNLKGMPVGAMSALGRFNTADEDS